MSNKTAGSGETAKNEFINHPPEIQQVLDAHRDQYLKDPEAAHYWDPIAIGVPGGPVATLLLEYRGRKSGKTLYTALQYYQRDGKVAIVASRGGSVDHPQWYLNLLEQPECTVRIASARYRAVARTVLGEERARWWEFITREQPVQREYEARTSRIIPVVILDPVR